MSPTKRLTGKRRGSIKREATVDHTDDSSPSRPAKRRRQVNSSELDIPEEADSSLLADASTVNLTDAVEVVNRVAQKLRIPANPTRDPSRDLQVAKDHANAKHEYTPEGVAAFAQILGQGWTFYVIHTTINIGRSTDPQAALDPKGEDFIHIDLGPNKAFSRQSARITFNDTWALEIKGRSGVSLDGVPLPQGASVPLTSGRVIGVGDVEMIFILPLETGDLRINPQYIERAGLQGTEFVSHGDDVCIPDVVEDTLRPTSSSAVSRSAARVALPRGPPQQQAIAPAPPDYRRPGTPPSSRHRAPHKNSSPLKDGALIMAASDVDLSADENQHIKPQYSYAQMITQSIMNTPDGKLNLSGIYSYIMNNYSYYRHQQVGGWQNSIRHNLSLNKAFEKVARSTDEPGKGMKWQIVPEVREEMIKNAFKGGRGGHRGSSNPSSPSQLNYVNQGPREMAARDQGSFRKRKVSPSGSPQPRSVLRDLHLTPDRNSRRLLPGEPGLAGDGSPLPRIRRTPLLPPPQPLPTSHQQQQQAASETLVGMSTDDQTAPRSPTLTSSYLQDDGASSFATPAPHRVNLRLAPPSTAQRPSQHMPTSSPAPFWRYADIGSTPLRQPAIDFSPSRLNTRLDPVPQSSSPTQGPSKSPVNSPTRRGGSRAVKAEEAESSETPGEATVTNDAEEDGGFDLTKGFQSIGSYHAPVGLGYKVARAASGGR